MLRGLVLAVLVLSAPGTGVAQAIGVLHITVSIADADRKATPVPRHRLQISDNPASAPPRRVTTSLEGVVTVRLAAGNYTVESEQPVAIGGKAYQWTATVDIVAGRDSRLELTIDNAEVVPISEAAVSGSSRLEADPSSLLAQWQASLVEIWSATAHGSGFLIDSSGLIVADQQVIGNDSSVEVQLSPSVKVAGTVLISDARSGIALVRVHPSISEKAKTLPIECEKAPEPLAPGQELSALEAPLGRMRRTSTGSVDAVLTNVIETDLLSGTGSTGGPAFGPSGELIGVTTRVPERDGERQRRSRIVRAGRVCELVAAETAKITDTPPPSATPLPVESFRPLTSDSSVSSLADAKASAGNQSLYRMSSSDFDILFITPAQLRAAQVRSDRTGAQTIAERLLNDFSNWSEYVSAMPSVVLIRVTPKLVEGFWTKIARGAAMTQGMSIPPIKRLKPDFESMRVLCDVTEVVPVHPFRLEHRVSDTDTLVEGFYAFDPGALTPACANVTLQIYSEKNPQKGDTLVVSAKVLQQIQQDMR